MSEQTAETGAAPAAAPAQQAAPQADDVAGNLARAEAALAAERRARQAAEAKLTRTEQQHMTDQEKAIAAARTEGKAEAAREAATAIAAAQFRAAAAGKLGNADAALGLLDVNRLLGPDGQPDAKAIAAAVEQLAQAAAPQAGQPAPARVPPGPRQAAEPQAEDFIRGVAAGALKGRV